MKAMNDNSNGSNNNWLGFSLSPQMKMEVVTDPQHRHHQYHHHSQAASSVPTSFYLSSHLNGSGICYGVAEAGGFHAPLSAMPLKSDGSCIIEAHRRSQSEGIAPASSRQLEDFLGGATEESYQYGSHEREAMALSLECLYYQNTDQETKGNHSLALLQDPVRQQDQEFAIQIHPYYSGLACQGIYQSPLEEETQDAQLTDCDSQIPQMGEETMPCSKNWEARHYSIHSSLEQQMNSSMFNNGAASGSCCTMGCGDLQSLSLSMSPGSQSSCITAPRQISPTATECLPMETETKGPGKMGQKLKQPVHRKSIDTFGQRTSQYRGVTRHRWTGRYEAHLWDNSCKKEGQTRKGRQVYLGGYDMEEKAARAYDLAALKYWGPSTHINFPLENYRDELEEMKNMSRQEYVAHLRRKSSGFSRGASTYRGVTRHHQHGRWQARIGRVAGNKDLYLGTFSTQEEAAEAYDIAAIKFRGVNAVTNFDITRYDVEKIMASNTLLPGELARRNKETNSSNEVTDYNTPMLTNGETIQHVVNNGNGSDWKKTLCQSTHQQLRTAGVESLNQNSAPTGSYRNPTSSMALQDLVGVDSVSSSQPTVDESTKLGTRSDPANGVNWFPSSAAELRPGARPISHLPVFAAWNDT